ncbi:MAG: Ig-like domain-containing protein [Caulobacter sp.]|nr:Ig-like domain-containing protein [Caulobacter sp.]
MRRATWLLGVAILALAGTAAAENTAYTYDSLGRLSSATYVDGGATYTITYSYDAAGNRTQVVNSNVSNTAPTAVNDGATTAVNTAVTFDPRANDSDANGDPLTISSKTDGAHGAVVINGGTSLTFTPATAYSGADSFTYTITDGQGGYATATVSVTVAAANQPPVAVGDSKTTAANTALTFDPRTNDSDPDGNPLTISSATNGAHGTVVVNGGTSVTFTPTAGYSGADSFTYTISDGQGGTATATVSMTISASNSAPVAVTDTNSAFALYTGGAGVRPTKTLDPRVNDTDANGDTLTITGVTQGAKGTVTFTGTTVTYRYGTATSSPLSTTDSFTYTISDGHGGTATATVNMTITVETNQ